jgi:hypothetical protein
MSASGRKQSVKLTLKKQDYPVGLSDSTSIAMLALKAAFKSAGVGHYSMGAPK